MLFAALIAMATVAVSVAANVIVIVAVIVAANVIAIFAVGVAANLIVIAAVVLHPALALAYVLHSLSTHWDCHHKSRTLCSAMWHSHLQARRALLRCHTQNSGTLRPALTFLHVPAISKLVAAPPAVVVPGYFGLPASRPVPRSPDLLVVSLRSHCSAP